MATGKEENFNLAYKVFRKHSADLLMVIQDPEVLAWELYAENIILPAVRDAVSYMMHEKSARTMKLLIAVESKIKVDPGAFNVFLSVLAKRPSMSDLCRRMKDAYEFDLPDHPHPQEYKPNLSVKKTTVKDQGETEPYNHLITRWKVVIVLIVLIALLICYNQPMFLHQPVEYKYSVPKNFRQYIHNVKQRYKTHLRDVAQSFWLPADMNTFIRLSLTNRDKLHNRSVDQYSANKRIVSERSMSFDDLHTEIDASPGSRILVVGQPGIGKTTLLQRITRYWAHDRALSSCWVLLHIVLRDLVLLQHAPNLTTFLSFMGNTWLPPDIEMHVFESDGKGLCFIADGLDEYPAGYEDTNFIFSLIRAQKLPQSTVVISSRPEITSRVWHSFDKHVEVLGFGDDQIDEYIQAKYGEDKSFSSYLDYHPHIKHTCYIPLHLAMLVYLKDYLLDGTNLPETETEIYEQFIFHTLVRDLCKNPTSSCSRKNTLPTSLNNIDNSSELGSLLFHLANLAYSGIWKKQSIFTEVEPVLQHTNSSLLVVDRMSILHPTTYSFPHLTIQEFLAALYFNTYLTRQEQKRVLVKISKHQRDWVFLRFCCGLKRNENQTTFLEFLNWLYQYNSESELPYHCAHEAQSLIASRQLINFTRGDVFLRYPTYLYDAVSFAFVAVSAAENLLRITAWNYKYGQFFLHKLCDTAATYSRLRSVRLYHFNLTSIGCLLQKSPNLESLHVSSRLRTENDTTVILPRYGVGVLSIRYIDFTIFSGQVLKLFQDLFFLETLLLEWNNTGDYGAHLNNIRESEVVLLLNHSIHNGCSLELAYTELNQRKLDMEEEKEFDTLDDFFIALVDAVNNGHKEDKSCQLKVRMSSNVYRLLCSDLRDIVTISEKWPGQVTLNASSNCLEMTEKILSRFEHYVGKDQEPPYMIWFQWTSYSVCTFYILLSTQTPRWCWLYFVSCLTIYILSSFDYLVQADYFIFIMSLLWSWIVVGRLIFCVSLKLLSKPWAWALIITIAVVVQLYFTDFKLIDYKFFVVLYIGVISGYILYHLRQTVFTVLFLYLLLQVAW